MQHRQSDCGLLRTLTLVLSLNVLSEDLQALLYLCAGEPLGTEVTLLFRLLA